ncbi:phosphate-starvation-inducible protein PsiE [Enterococcus rivorum]|uniref:Protein PsiE n=1 Tax=Enterococcus rivorum TaxID=762845 RepID=A0A1E5KYQ9_9ENTE|nr:phosphate-starvation-inducible protein PsiE [Enterococcus rivorum]MBP2097572.1 protein PsiE [Enterococcus rivorum]OEH83022.1 phosphate-starvation-inducible protein PsiE [Enterococcus rivorum]
MKIQFETFKKFLTLLLDILLGMLALLLIVFMVKQWVDIVLFVKQPLAPKVFSLLIQEITSFFILFEFVIMVIRYIQEGHHIPIRYLVLICITAVLRQLMVIHGDGMQTLLLSLSIFVLVLVLFVLSIQGNSFHSISKKHMNEESEENQQ